MTTKDKTGDRLVASIRRTRASGENADGEKETPTPKSASRRPAAKKKAATAAPKSASAARKRSTKKPADSRSGYQSGGRVWPD